MGKDVGMVGTAKTRVHLWVTKVNLERLKAAAARVPGMSVSGLVDDYLRQLAPMVEGLADAVDAGDPEAMRRAFAMAVGGAMWDAYGSSRDDGGDT